MPSLTLMILPAMIVSHISHGTLQRTLSGTTRLQLTNMHVRLRNSGLIRSTQLGRLPYLSHHHPHPRLSCRVYSLDSFSRSYRFSSFENPVQRSFGTMGERQSAFLALCSRERFLYLMAPHSQVIINDFRKRMQMAIVIGFVLNITFGLWRFLLSS